MAHLRPTNLPPPSLAGPHLGELETLTLLQRSLSADYTVFHGVHWTNERPIGVMFGEADFIIVNRSGDVLVIEQKNGAVTETADGLFKDYKDSRKKIVTQVHRCINNIRTKFAEHNRNGQLLIDYLVYCPDQRLVRVNAPGLDRTRIVDASRARDLCAIIATILPKGLDSAQGELVNGFFQQTLQLAPDVHAHITAGDKAMVRLWGTLAQTVESIDMEPLRLRVVGVPGCGKTTIAAHHYEAALRKGKRPLLVCFNRPLAERLKASLPRQGGMVETWYGLIVRFLRDQGQTVDFSAGTSETFWADVRDRVLGPAFPAHWSFDTIIVDEGQDFAPDWFDTLQLFAGPAADILWLEDPNQKLNDYPVIDFKGKGYTGFRAETNYRSPDTIARYIQKTLPFTFIAGNPLPGLGVGVRYYDDPGEQGGLSATVVAELLGRGFKPSEIVILTMKGVERATLGKAARVGRYTLSRFTGDYDVFGNQTVTPGQVLFESIRRFKGQQAPAVIVTDIDPHDDPDGLWQRFLLCAATRATVRLELIARRGNPLTTGLG